MTEYEAREIMQIAKQTRERASRITLDEYERMWYRGKAAGLYFALYLTNQISFNEYDRLCTYLEND